MACAGKAAPALLPIEAAKLAGVQEPVHKLKQDYMGAIDKLAPVLGREGAQKVGCIPSCS